MRSRLRLRDLLLSYRVERKQRTQPILKDMKWENLAMLFHGNFASEAGWFGVSTDMKYDKKKLGYPKASAKAAFDNHLFVSK